MTITTGQALIVQQAFETLGYDTRSYSGRGMYGKSCLGVTCDNPIKAVIQVVQEIRNNISTDEDLPDTYENSVDAQFNQIMSELKNVSSDSMGLSQIIYFPLIPFIDCDTDSDKYDNSEDE